MKTFIPLFFTLFLGVAVFAQAPQSFRYQAVARDNSGNILANELVSFRISILSGSISGSAVYSETHTGLSTNTFGLVELQIGKGTPVTGTFSAINWGNNSYFVKVEMDPAGGSAFQTLSTSQLLSVPYALHAKTVETGDNWGSQMVNTDATLTGSGTSASNLKLAQQGAASGQVLKWNGSTWLPSADLSGSDVWQISGSNIYRSTGNVGIGTSTPRALLHTKGTGAGGGDFLAEGLFKDKPDVPPISGAGTRMMWYPDKAAFRVGLVNANQWDKDSTGNYSVAMGLDTKAKGEASVAIGNSSVATADYAVALGGVAKASGVRSVAIGAGTTATNSWSIAIGSYSTASGLYATALGHVNTAEGNYSMALGENTTAYSGSEVVVGSFNSTYTPVSKTGWNVTDRLFVIGNGTVSVPHNAMTVLKNGNTGIGIDIPTALLHVNGTGTGEGNVLFNGNYKSSSPGDPPASGSGTRMMWYPDKAALRAGAITGNQWDKDSIGLHSVSMGYNSKAVGLNAFAFGRESKARGERSFALGDYAYAVGNGSVALGTDSRANGLFSVSLGNTNADSYFSTTVGVNNVGGGSKTTWVATDPLFEIGNSQSSVSPKNALTILKNANVGIGTGATKPEYLLSMGANDVGIHVPATNTLSVHTDGVERMRISSSGNVGIGNISPAVKLHLQNSTGDLRLRMQSDAANELQYYDNSGNFEASVGYSKSQGHLYLYQGGNVAIKGGKLGVGTIEPAAKLDVNGTVKIGASGSLLTGIVLLRGYMSYDKTKDESYILFPYPAGFNKDNTVVLASEWITLDNNWIESDYHSCRDDGIFVTQHTNVISWVKVVIMCFQ
jgi:hypothetical protein